MLSDFPLKFEANEGGGASTLCIVEDGDDTLSVVEDGVEFDIEGVDNDVTGTEEEGVGVEADDAEADDADLSMFAAASNGAELPIAKLVKALVSSGDTI